MKEPRADEGVSHLDPPPIEAPPPDLAPVDAPSVEDIPFGRQPKFGGDPRVRRRFFDGFSRARDEANGHAPSKPLNEIHEDIRKLNDKHALVSEGGRATIITERLEKTLNRIVLDRSSVADFKTFYRNKAVPVGNRYVKLGDFWLDHEDRRQYDEIVFDPDPEREADPRVYNLWRDWSVWPDEGDWSLFRQHIFEVGAAGDEDIFNYLMDWFAWLVQKPHLPAETAIVWRGAQGAGKGFIAKMFGRLAGQHFVHITSSRHLVGNFNAHLRDALLVFADEAFWAGDKEGEGVLKTLVTEPMLMIEGKYRDSVNMPNRIHMMIATNKEWAVPVEHGDRRYGVIEVPDSFVGDRAYFDRIDRQMREGGLAAMLLELLRRPVSRSPMLPRSAFALEYSFRQKLFSMSPTNRWWFEKLETGNLLKKGTPGWDQWVEKSALHADYIENAEVLKISRRSSETELGLALRELARGLGEAKRATITGERKRFWHIPDLQTCRESFCSLMKLPVTALFAETPEE